MPFKKAHISKDLKDLIRLLRKYKFNSSNLIEVHSLDDLLRKQNKNWKQHKVKEIIFNISKSKMKPNPQVKKISISLSLDGLFSDSMSKGEEAFTEYSMQLLIHGYGCEDAAPNEISNYFSWHLDKEEFTDGAFAHPYYHFHAGGDYIKGKELGDLLMISSPRIPHPPMDVFLAIHFVLLNFVNTTEYKDAMKILKDVDYIQIIQRAQKRVLDPYFASLNGKSHSKYTKHNLFPLY